MEINFRTSEIDTSSNFAPVPSGVYQVELTKAEEQLSKSGNTYLKCELEILSGDYRGRKLWNNFNLLHTSDMAREIAMKEFTMMCNAMGVADPVNTDQLLHIPFAVSVKLESNNSDGSDRNVIKKYLPIAKGGEDRPVWDYAQ